MKKALLLLLANLLLFSTLSAQTASQTIRGIVVEKNSGHSVPYATVVVADLQPTAGTTGDSLGRFVLRRVPVGRHDLQVSCLGYEPVLLKEILVGSSKEVVLEIRLQESLVAVEEVVVRPRIDKTEPLNEMALAGGRMLRVEEASRYAGSMDDPARLVSSFAGVASTVGNNGIVVRGNAPKFLQWRMEGVEIPNPNHFAEVTSFGGGGLTALSSQVLGNSDFYTGAFRPNTATPSRGSSTCTCATATTHATNTPSSWASSASMPLPKAPSRSITTVPTSSITAIRPWR